MSLAFESPIPVLRSFDDRRADEFYLGFLGFQLDWTHRFEPDLPRYCQVSRTGLVLHLSAHHGDGCPGQVLRLPMRGLDSLAAKLAEKRYGFARPSVETTPWGWRELRVADPFGTRLVFAERDEPRKNIA